jgi:hypothetical protein
VRAVVKEPQQGVLEGHGCVPEAYP